jgi:hypothetical protein
MFVDSANDIRKAYKIQAPRLLKGQSLNTRPVKVFSALREYSVLDLDFTGGE